MTPDEAYQWLVEHGRETAYLKSMSHLLGWDQRTQIPEKGHEHRHNQFAMLAKWIHLRATDPQVGEALARVEASELVAEDIAPIDDVRSTAEYRRQIAALLVREALQQAWKRSRGEA